jgi:hypothetical protein
MPPVDYNKQCNEWTSISLYRTALKSNPAIKLSTWAANSNFDYARLVLKNAEVRKIENIDEQIKFCTDKVAQLKIKLGKKGDAKVAPDVPPTPPVEINTDVKQWQEKYNSCYTELIKLKQAELQRQLSFEQMELFKPSVAAIPLPESESDADSENSEEDNLINLVLGSDIDSDDEDSEEDEDEDEDDYEDF